MDKMKYRALRSRLRMFMRDVFKYGAGFMGRILPCVIFHRHLRRPMRSK